MKVSRISAITLMVLFLTTGICFSQVTGEYRREGAQHDSETKFEEEYAEEIKQLVKGLEYSDKVAEDFVQMVSGWRDVRGQPVLAAWNEKLAEAKEDYKQGEISKDQLAKIEESIAKELIQRIQKEISFSKEFFNLADVLNEKLAEAKEDYKQGEISKDQLAKIEESIAKELIQRIQKEISVNIKFFDLVDVIKHRQAQCLGYSQLFYVLGNSVGLSVKAIDVAERMIAGPLPTGHGHIACIVRLTDGKMMMVDLIPGGFVSRPFIIKKEFTKVGNYWELKDKDNPLGIHRRIQILDRNGLTAGIYNNRGNAYANLGQYSQAISDYTRAIELNPKFAGAYYSRGVVYANLGQYSQAISDYTRAIELNPKFAEAYNNRGGTYANLGQYIQAISDSTKAIELDPKYAKAYYNRGVIYHKLGRFNQAISDYTKAIELNPKYAKAYFGRGVTYDKLGQYSQAISDYTRAIELEPEYAVAYLSRGFVYACLGKFEEARKDLLKAVELDPALEVLVKEVSDYFKLNLKLE